MGEIIKAPESEEQDVNMQVVKSAGIALAACVGGIITHLSGAMMYITMTLVLSTVCLIVKAAWLSGWLKRGWTFLRDLAADPQSDIALKPEQMRGATIRCERFTWTSEARLKSIREGTKTHPDGSTEEVHIVEFQETDR